MTDENFEKAVEAAKKEFRELLKSTTLLEFPDAAFTDKTEAALFLPVALTMEKALVGELIKLINLVKKTRPEMKEIPLKLITRKTEIAEIEEKLGEKLHAEKGIFNILFLKSPYSGKLERVSLMEVVSKPEQVARSFAPIKETSSEKELNKLVDGIFKDELLMVVKSSPEKKQETLRLFKKVIVDSQRVNFRRVIPVWFSSGGADSSSVEAVMKKPRVGTQPKEGSRHERFSFELSEDGAERALDDLSAGIDEFTVFRNNFVAGKEGRFRVDFFADKSRDSPGELAALRGALREAKAKLGELADSFDFHLNFQRFGDGEREPPRVVAVDAAREKTRMFLRHENKDRRELADQLQEDPTIIDPVPAEFALTQEVTADSLATFCRDVVEENLPVHYRSQLPPKFQKFSRRLVGVEFEQKVLNNAAPQALFYYADGCASCKRFMPLFEELALEALTRGSGVTFSRVNNELNSSPRLRFFVSTPRILFYRGDYKAAPYSYKRSQLNKKMMSDFFQLSGLFKFVDEKLYENVAGLAEKVVAETFKPPAKSN